MHTRSRIDGVERLRNDGDGNPRWRVTFADGTVADTEPNSDYGYVVSEYVGHVATVEVNDKAEIVYLRVRKDA